MAKLKSRVTYPKELKAGAKEHGLGLATISVTCSDGSRLEEQGTMTVQEYQFLKWTMTMVFCDEVKKLPDVQEFIRQQIERKV